NMTWSDLKQHGALNSVFDIIEKDLPIPFLILIKRLFL
ncbi:MAG: hypothetical protein ACI93S_001315, partial [Ancylomarina sp.]